MNIVWTSQFKKDYKRAKKQGKDLGDLRSVIAMLARRELSLCLDARILSEYDEVLRRPRFGSRIDRVAAHQSAFSQRVPDVPPQAMGKLVAIAEPQISPICVRLPPVSLPEDGPDDVCRIGVPTGRWPSQVKVLQA